MAVQDGHGKIATNGLIFGYDVKDTVNSYLGEPTINQANTDYTRTIQFHNQGTYNNAGTISDAPEKGPDWKKIIITDRGNNFRIAQFPYIIQNYGTTKVYSIEYDFGSTSGYFFYGDGSSGFGVSQDDGRRVTARFTPPYETDWYEALFLGHNTPASNIKDTIYYRYYQVEEKSYPTRYTPTSRSVTQGLLDLTRTKTLSLANASFDSDSSIILDGTDDYISGGPSTSYLPLQYHSLEACIKSPGLGPGMNTCGIFGITYGLIVQVFASGEISYYAYSTDGGTQVLLFALDSTNINLLDNNWHHIVCTRDSSNVNIYIDGVLNRTTGNGGNWSGTNVWSSMNLLIGDNPNNIHYHFNGSIDVAKIYNRALTAVEVLQNFKTYRSKYSID